MRAINLLPRDDGRRNRPVAASRPVLVGVVGGVFVTAVLAAAFLMQAGKVAGKRNELESLKAQLGAMPAPPPGPSADDVQLADAQKQRATALSTVLARRIAWDRVLRELSLVLPEDVWFSTLKATAPLSSASDDAPVAPRPGAKPTGLTITGHTYSHDGVARLLSRLAVLPDLANVQLERSVLIQEDGRPPVVDFTILAEVRPAVAAS